MPTPLHVYVEQKRAKREAERLAKRGTGLDARTAPVEQAPAPPPPVVRPSDAAVARVEAMLAIAQRDLEAADAALAEASYAALVAEAGDERAADGALQEASQARAQARERVATATSALATARDRQALADAQDAAVRHAGAVEAVRFLLKERADATAALAEAIAAAATAWRKLLNVNTSIRRAFPGPVVPLGVAMNPGEIDRAIAAELYRLSAQVGTGGGVHALPGAACPSIQQALAPGSLTPLSEVIRLSDARILADLTSLAPPPPPSTARGSSYAHTGPQAYQITSPAAPEAQPPVVSAIEVQATLPRQDLSLYLAAPAAPDLAGEAPADTASTAVVGAEPNPAKEYDHAKACHDDEADPKAGPEAGQEA